MQDLKAEAYEVICLLLGLALSTVLEAPETPRTS
jgi:hypothetical protein